MGCDVHIAVEQRDSPEDSWEAVSEFEEEEDFYQLSTDLVDSSRNYLIFGAIAGVRVRMDGSLEPKGIPDDLSDDLQQWINTCLEHTPSWLTYEELQGLVAQVCLFPNKFDGRESANHIKDKITDWLESLDICCDKKQKRIVFFFDS